jgi:hypothetical protein
MTRVSPPRILLLVDTVLRERTPEEHVNVERAIAMAASLADHALAGGLLVGLVVYTGNANHPNGFSVLQPNRGKRQRRELLEILATLPLNESRDSRQLLNAASGIQQFGTTPVLLTPRAIVASLSDQSRGTLIQLSATSSESQSYFSFPSSVDFARCMPPDQQPKMKASDFKVPGSTSEI